MNNFSINRFSDKCVIRLRQMLAARLKFNFRVYPKNYCNFINKMAFY